MKNPVQSIIVISVLALCFTFKLKAQENTANNLEIFGSKKNIPFSLTGNIYLLPEETYKLPKSFNKKYSIGTINTNELNISSRGFENGFPGISNRTEWFAIDYHGFFYIKEADVYMFALESDDGSKLFINDHLLIDNDGGHAPETKYGGIYLKKGIHRMNVQYFQGPRYFIALRLLYKKEGAKHYEVFSYEDFKPVDISELSTEPDKKTDCISIEMEGSILFDFDDATLKKNAQLILNEIYHSFAENDTIGIIIEGHTDDKGSEEYNKKLALNRAKSVSNYLNSNFKTDSRTWCISLGELKPKYTNNSNKSRAKNRRVEILLMNKEKAKSYYMKNSSAIYRN